MKEGETEVCVCGWERERERARASGLRSSSALDACVRLLCHAAAQGVQAVRPHDVLRQPPARGKPRTWMSRQPPSYSKASMILV